MHNVDSDGRITGPWRDILKEAMTLGSSGDPRGYRVFLQTLRTTTAANWNKRLDLAYEDPSVGDILDERGGRKTYFIPPMQIHGLRIIDDDAKTLDPNTQWYDSPTDPPTDDRSSSNVKSVVDRAKKVAVKPSKSYNKKADVLARLDELSPKGNRVLSDKPPTLDDRAILTSTRLPGRRRMPSRGDATMLRFKPEGSDRGGMV